VIARPLIQVGPRAVAAGLRARRVLARRRLVSELAQGHARALGIVAIGVVIAVAVFLGAYGGAAYVVWRGAPEVVRTAMSFVLLGLSGALVLSSLGHAANSFFSAQDLWFWDSTPVPPWARFVDRSIDTAIHALPMTLLLGGTAMVGLCTGAGYGFSALLRALLAVLLVGLIPLSFGIVLAHVGGSLLPAGKLRRASLLVLGVAVAALLVWFRRARVEKALTQEGAAELLANARAYQDLGSSMLPWSFGSSFVVDGNAGSFAGLLAWTALCLGAAMLAHRLLSRRARDLAVDESPIGLLHGSLRDRLLEIAVRPVSVRLRPVVQKDLLAFLRDPAQWGQVVLLLGVGALYLVNADALRQGFAQMPEIGAAILPAMHAGLVAFIASGLAVRFAFPQVGLEGPAVWIVDGSPLPPRALLTAKWIASMPVVVVYPTAVGIVGGHVLDLELTLWLATTVLCAAVSLGVAAFGVGRGAEKPLFDAASLSELAMGPGAISTMVWSVSFAFFGAVGALVAGIAVAATDVDRWAHPLPQGYAAAIALLATAIPSMVAWRAGQRALDSGALAFVKRREDEAERAFAERTAPAGPIVVDE
jgi:ABC-2 type transport system permease protein